MKEDGIRALNCVELTNVVSVSVSAAHWIFDVLSKSSPVTTRVNAGPPALAASGLMLVSEGTSAHKAVTLTSRHKLKGPAFLSRNPRCFIFGVLSSFQKFVQPGYGCRNGCFGMRGVYQHIGQ
jgi:hypothetical protein